MIDHSRMLAWYEPMTELVPRDGYGFACRIATVPYHIGATSARVDVARRLTG